MGCKCEDKSFTIRHTHKLRVPLTTKNKVVFRKFLNDCPQFVNCIEESQIPYFRDFLRKLKYFEEIINGRDFTFVKKGSKYETNLFL